MVVLDVRKEVNCDDRSSSSLGSSSERNLRDENRRTGRYVAAGTAIVLSILGVYELLIQGTPQYAAIFVPIVIMFVYVLWILHTSRHQNAQRLLRLKQAASKDEVAVGEARKLVSESKEMSTSQSTVQTCETEIKVSKEKLYSRSYSIA